MPHEEYTIQWPHGVNIGDLVGAGNTAMVARLDAVIKWVKPHKIAYIERESQVYERLGNHPRLLRYYGSIANNGIIIQYAHHHSIRQYVRNHIGKVPLAQRLRWAVDTTEALIFIHSKAIFHGDISCNNVFLDQSLNVKIGDFAGSSIDGKEALTCYETRYDNPRSNGVVSTASEIFALGSMFFELMNGFRPYDDLTDNAVERAYLEGNFPNVASSDACGYIIHNCWTGTYQDLEALLNDLKAEALRTSGTNEIGRFDTSYALHYVSLVSPVVVFSIWTWLKYRHLL